MALPGYDIDFKKMVKLLLPALLRKPVRVAWLTASFKGLRAIHDNFLAFTDAKMDEVKYNGQTFIMEKMLEAKFGPGITITNNINSLDGLFVGDGNDVSSFIGSGNDTDTYIDIIYTVDVYNFTVSVPSAIVFVQSEMEAYIRKYKMFGTTFNIVIV
jgi:hypothetical protein